MIRTRGRKKKKKEPFFCFEQEKSCVFPGGKRVVKPSR